MWFRTIIGKAVSIRLVVAFVIGLLCGILAWNIGRNLQNLVPYLLFPLLIGIASAFSVRPKNPRPYLVALATGLVSWTGITLYLGLLAGLTTSRVCPVQTCGTVDVLKDLLPLYLAIGFVLVALAAFLTSTTLRYYRMGRNSSF